MTRLSMADFILRNHFKMRTMHIKHHNAAVAGGVKTSCILRKRQPKRIGVNSSKIDRFMLSDQ